jgi:hypothetical protein
MIHVTKPEDSKNIKYSINPMGAITVYSLNPKSVGTKEKLTEGKSLSSAVIPTEYKGIDYQSMLASLLVQDETKDSWHVININYRNPPKTVSKPNRFEVESKRILSFGK